MVAEAPQEVYSHLSPLELIRNEIRTQRDETVPLSSIITEFAIIDDNHAEELRRLMSQDRGQLTPILVRAREEGGIVYDVMDGFHRTEGRRLSGASDIRATVVYACGDEEMYDLRIVAASSVQSIQFPRMAEWLTKSYSSTEWAKLGVPVHQAFAITVNDSNAARGVRLDKKKLDELKLWAQEKCKKWEKTASYIYAILRTVADADPELVRGVRRASGGLKDRAGVITPARLTSVVELYPGTKNFRIQRGIMQFAREKRLSADEVKTLSQRLGNRVRPGMSEGDIVKAIQLFYEAGGDHIIRKPVISEQLSSVSEQVFSSEALLVEERQLDGMQAPPKDPSKAQPIPQSGGRLNMADLLDIERRQPPDQSPEHLAERIKELEDQNRDLERIVADLNQKRETSGRSDGRWWNTTPGLTPPERQLIEAILVRYMDLNDITDSLHGGMAQLVRTLNSALAKRRAFIATMRSG